jgi:hypothetical protein
MPKEKKLSRMLMRRLVRQGQYAIDDIAIRENQGLKELMILSVKWRL